LLSRNKGSLSAEQPAGKPMDCKTLFQDRARRQDAYATGQARCLYEPALETAPMSHYKPNFRNDNWGGEVGPVSPIGIGRASQPEGGTSSGVPGVPACGSRVGERRPTNHRVWRAGARKPTMRVVDLLAAERRNRVAWGVSPRTGNGIGLLAAKRRYLSGPQGVAAPRLGRCFRIGSRG